MKGDQSVCGAERAGDAGARRAYGTPGGLGAGSQGGPPDTVGGWTTLSRCASPRGS